MKNRISKWLIVLFAFIFVASTGLYFYQMQQSQTADEIYQEAEEIAKAPEKEQESETETEIPEEQEETETTEKGWHEVEVSDDEYMAELEKTDLAALREVNEDVIGWIEIPDTQLSYPLMKGLDNQYYLEHTWDKKKSSAGSVFMERLNNEDFSHYHTVLYGHRMADGTIFDSLKHYTTEEYFAQHPYFYIYDDNGAHRYEIFAAYEADVGSRTYQVGFADESSKESFLNYCKEKSVVDTGVVPTTEDRIVTLSTCTAFGSEESRWVVQGRLLGMIVE